MSFSEQVLVALARFDRRPFEMVLSAQQAALEECKTRLLESGALPGEAEPRFLVMHRRFGQPTRWSARP